MSPLSQYAERSVGRRERDRLVRSQNYRFRQLFTVGQFITSEIHMDALFEVIMDQTNKIMDTARSTVFLLDEKNDALWSLAATGMVKNQIRIKANAGVAGWVLRNRAPLISNQAYDDARFCPDVDRASGFRTRNLLCVPVINRQGRCMGVLQALNKISADFTDDDVELLDSVSNYVAIAIENSKLYEDVKKYSEELRANLLRIEILEEVKAHLTKFVPSSVAELAEQDPHQLTKDKIPTDVTVLFIDIEDFASITQRLDQKLVNDIVERHFSKYLDCIKRHGGEVNETSGDGLMVLFKEDCLESQAMEAVAAGLEIAAENERLNESRSHPEGDVYLHLGVNSGKAWVGSTKMKSMTGERWTYTASGLMTVLAARIGALSSRCRMYVGEDTYRCIQHRCSAEFLGLQTFKNVSEPVPVYWIKGITRRS